MNDLSRGETVLLIVLIWATWIIFYWAGKNNLLSYMSDTISDSGKQLSGSMRKTEKVKITKNEREKLNRSNRMERNEIERIFKSYLPAVRAYNLAMDKFRRIDADAQALKAMVITGMPRGSGKSDPTAAAASRMLKAAQAVRVAAYRYAKIIMEYERLVALVTDQQAVEIIRLRWEQDIEFDYIPARIHTARRTMFYHYRRAIEEISEKTKGLH